MRKSETDRLSIRLRHLPNGKGLELPQHETDLSAGMDLRAAIPAEQPVTIEPGAAELFPTGLQIALPPGVEAQIRPRSGLAMRSQVTVLNSPGTIDADYRGEIGVLLINHGASPFTVERGDRIAQLVVARHVQVAWNVVEELPETARGAGGFGSTGQR